MFEQHDFLNGFEPYAKGALGCGSMVLFIVPVGCFFAGGRKNNHQAI
jgi:hypothetical protein